MVFILIISLFLKPVFPFVEYVVNYNYIVTELCENRATPEMGCNGKCYLMKELAKNTDTEKPLSSDKKNNSSHTLDILFNPLKEYTVGTISSISHSTVNSGYSNLYTYLVGDATFHPPSFIS